MTDFNIWPAYSPMDRWEQERKRQAEQQKRALDASVRLIRRIKDQEAAHRNLLESDMSGSVSTPKRRKQRGLRERIKEWMS